jgi:hypothetical protein
MMIDPYAPCPHENFDAVVGVARLLGEEGVPVVGFSGEIRVRCADCDEPFRWTGVPAGQSTRQPMCSVDETELRAPLRPASADPDIQLENEPGLNDFVTSGRR